MHVFSRPLEGEENKRQQWGKTNGKILLTLAMLHLMCQRLALSGPPFAPFAPKVFPPCLCLSPHARALALIPV